MRLRLSSVLEEVEPYVGDHRADEERHACRISAALPRLFSTLLAQSNVHAMNPTQGGEED